MKIERINLGSFTTLLVYCGIAQAHRVDLYDIVDMSPDSSSNPYRRNEEVEIFKKDITPATANQTATLIFLHGKGMTGRAMKTWVDQVGKPANFSHMKILYPTAPAQCWEQTLYKSTILHVWLHSGKANPEDDDITCYEKIDWITKCTQYLHQIIQREYFSGIPLHRIIIGGYQSGGAMAMHLGFRVLPQVAGVFALSSYLYNTSFVYEHLDSDQRPSKLPPLFFYSGDRCGFTRFEWAKRTASELKKRNVTGHYEAVWNKNDNIDQRELFQLWLWIERTVPKEYNG